MKSFLKHSTLAALVAFPLAAQAQSPTDAANFSHRLKIQTRFDLSDSFRKNQLDIFSGTARFGVNYKYKNVMAVIELQGSNSDKMFVRRAQTGVQFFKSDPATVALHIGRDRLIGSLVTAPDAMASLITTNHDDASAADTPDGLWLKYDGKFGFGNVMATAGTYNSIPALLQLGGTDALAKISSSTASPVNMTNALTNSYASAPVNESRAYAGVFAVNVAAGDGMAEVRGLYSTQDKAADKNTTTLYRDVTTSEASAAYNYKNGQAKVGLWYNSVTLSNGKTKNTVTGTSVNNDFKYTPGPGGDGFTTNIFGLGFKANSGLFGLTGLVESGDALTFGAGYQMQSGQKFSNNLHPDATARFANKAVDTTALNLAVGYMQGTFNLELNYAMLGASKEIYYGSDAKLNKKDASLVYLTGVIVL